MCIRDRATTLAIKLWGSVGAGIATGILTFLILVFGEISPKTFATLYADQISIAYSGIIGFLMKILTPVDVYKRQPVVQTAST